MTGRSVDSGDFVGFENSVDSVVDYWELLKSVKSIVAELAYIVTGVDNDVEVVGSSVDTDSILVLGTDDLTLVLGTDSILVLGIDDSTPDRGIDFLVLVHVIVVGNSVETYAEVVIISFHVDG